VWLHLSLALLASPAPPDRGHGDAQETRAEHRRDEVDGGHRPDGHGAAPHSEHHHGHHERWPGFGELGPFGGEGRFGKHGHPSGHSGHGRRATAQAPEGHVAWFPGTFEDALAEARQRSTLTLVDFWAPWCGSCDRLARESFCDAAVLAELEPLVCVEVDASHGDGRELARRFELRGVPTLLVFSSAGAPHDALQGYLTPEELVGELRRIRAGREVIPDLRRCVAEAPADLAVRFALLEKLAPFGVRDEVREQRAAIEALVEAGQGYDPRSVESRYRLAEALRGARMRQAAEAQWDAIEAQDPGCITLPAQRVRLERLGRRLHHARDPREDLASLEAFVRSSPHAELRFEGWQRLYSLRSRMANRSHDPELRGEGRALARADARTLWSVTPVEHRAEVGGRLAWDFHHDGDGLDAADLSFALEVAALAAAAAGEDPGALDAWACLLHRAGRDAEALELVSRCEVLEPKSDLWARRRAEFGAAVPVSAAR
jgi:thiol-disulfide isomerase/thioredoxin